MDRESVWDYPRPPRLEPSQQRIRVEFNGEMVADTTRAYRVLGMPPGCLLVGEERVQSQEGDFYGGWITSNLAGPFKGGPGTHGW